MCECEYAFGSFDQAGDLSIISDKVDETEENIIHGGNLSEVGSGKEPISDKVDDLKQEKKSILTGILSEVRNNEKPSVKSIQKRGKPQQKLKKRQTIKQSLTAT